MSTINDYMVAREEYVTQQKNVTNSQVALKAARYKFNLAKAALRAEESELLEDVVQ